MTKKRLSFVLVAIILVVALVGTCLVGCSSKVKEANSSDVLMHVVRGAVFAADGINFSNFEVGANATMKVNNGGKESEYKITVAGKLNLLEKGSVANIVVTKGETRVFSLYYHDSGEDKSSSVFMTAGSKAYSIKALSISKVLNDKLTDAQKASLADSTARYSDVDFDAIESAVGSVITLIVPNDITKKNDEISSNAKMNKKGTEATLSVSLANLLNPDSSLGKMLGDFDVSSILDPLGISLDISNILNILPALSVDLSFSFDKADKATKVNKLTNVTANLSVGAKDIDIKKTTDGSETPPANTSLLKFSIPNDISVSLTSSIAFGAGSATNEMLSYYDTKYTAINAVNLNMGGTVVGTKDGETETYTLDVNLNVDPTVFRDLDFNDFSKHTVAAEAAWDLLSTGIRDVNISIKNDTKTFLSLRARYTTAGLTIDAGVLGITIPAAALIKGLVIDANLPADQKAYEEKLAAEQAQAEKDDAQYKNEKDLAKSFAPKMFDGNKAKYLEITAENAAEIEANFAGYADMLQQSKDDAQTEFIRLIDEKRIRSYPYTLDELANATKVVTERAEAEEWINEKLLKDGNPVYSKVNFDNYTEIATAMAPYHGFYASVKEYAAEYYEDNGGTKGASMSSMANTTMYMVGSILQGVSIEIKDGVTIGVEMRVVTGLISGLLGNNVNATIKDVINRVLEYDTLQIQVNKFTYGGYVNRG